MSTNSNVTHNTQYSSYCVPELEICSELYLPFYCLLFLWDTWPGDSLPRLIIKVLHKTTQMRVHIKKWVRLEGNLVDN